MDPEAKYLYSVEDIRSFLSVPDSTAFNREVLSDLLGQYDDLMEKYNILLIEKIN